MKEYFSHDINAMQDPKMMYLVANLGTYGVGVYWIIIEILHQQESGRIKESELDACLEFYQKIEPQIDHEDSTIMANAKQIMAKVGLLLTDGEYYYSERVLRNKQIRECISEKRKVAGKIGAAHRWEMANGWQKIANDSKGKEKKEKEIKEKNTTYANGFVEFWAMYPKKTGKDCAYKSWLAKNPPLDVCLRTLTWQTNSDQWTKDGGKYIPMPATWINQGRWNDEPTQIKSNGAAPIPGKYDNIGERV